MQSTILKLYIQEEITAVQALYIICFKYQALSGGEIKTGISNKKYFEQNQSFSLIIRGKPTCLKKSRALMYCSKVFSVTPRNGRKKALPFSTPKTFSCPCHVNRKGKFYNAETFPRANRGNTVLRLVNAWQTNRNTLTECIAILSSGKEINVKLKIIYPRDKSVFSSIDVFRWLIFHLYMVNTSF